MSKNTKVNNSNLTSRLGSTKGRFVGITTVNSRGQVTKYNAQVRGQSESYVTVFDRNRQEVSKLSKASIVSLSGV